MMSLSLNDIHQKLEEFEIKFKAVEQTNKLLSRQIKELFLLYDATKKLNKSKYFREVTNTITSILRKDFHADEFSIFLFDFRSKILNIRYSNGIPKRDIKEFFYHPDEGFVGKTFITGEPIYLRNLSDYKNFKYYQTDKKIQGCILYVPLKLSLNETIGVLKLRKPIPDSFSDTEQNILNQLSEPFTVSLKNGLALDEIDRNAWIDDLTGLFTVKYFKKRYDAEIRRAQRYQHPMSIIFMSIDNSGAIFRKYGKNKRDIVIKEFASFLQDNTRMSDICFRYSPNQFLILLPETLKSAAENGLKKIQSEWDARLAILQEDYSMPIKVSFGYANYPKDTIEPPLLLKLALETAQNNR